MIGLVAGLLRFTIGGARTSRTKGGGERGKREDIPVPARDYHRARPSSRRPSRRPPAPGWGWRYWERSRLRSLLLLFLWGPGRGSASLI